MRPPFPHSLPSWLLTILISGLLATQAATLWIVSQDRRDANNALELFRVSEHATSLARLLAATPPAEWDGLARNLSDPEQKMSVGAEPEVATALASEDDLAELEDVLVARLSHLGVVDARIRRDIGAFGPRSDRPGAGDDDIGAVEKQIDSIAATASAAASITTSLQFNDGRWLNFSTRITPADPIVTRETVPLFALVAASVVLAAVWATRRLTAPYRILEKAVGRIGEDLKAPPLPENGIREYKAAAHAVNAMQARLVDYVSEREQLAAALAHDLRTPLTRMRLRLELLDDEALARSLARDLDNIDVIARSVIDFATFEAAAEPKEKLDLRSLMLSVTDHYPQVEVADSEARAVALCQPVSMRRCFTNLIENALAYGGEASVSLDRDGAELVFSVRDRGPGIPEEQIERMFSPFVRAEGSRNRESGGFGLGLTIARNIARGNGGDISLRNAPGGGLIAEARLPAAG